MRTSVQAVILATIFTVCTAFTLGLTFAPCYASLCSEEFFPVDVRIHIAVYFALIASIAVPLLLRAYVPACHRFSTIYITKRPVPIFDRHFTIGGVAAGSWIVFVVLITTAFWYQPLAAFWSAKTDAVQWAVGEIPLIVTSIIGHHADMLLGLLLIPVGRNSLLVRVFKLPYSTILYAHKLLGYSTVIATWAHGVAYIIFWARYSKTPDPSPERVAFDVNNPTLSVAEAQARGAYSRATLGTGLASFVFMLIIVVTALPKLRRRAYNIFYYTHIVMSLLILVGASIHASTNFYFILPGLLLWTFDWAWRLFGGEIGLIRETTVSLSSAGGGWYRIVLPLAAVPDVEAQSTRHPLQTYFVNIPAISKVQNHALTAAKVSTSTTGAVLLLQQSTAVKRSAKAQGKEWTWKLAKMIDERDKALEVTAHIEGPYEPPYTGHKTADIVVCIVGGTGLTGGYSLAQWWFENRRNDQATFVLVWTARYKEALKLEEWEELVQLTNGAPNMSLTTHCSSVDGRLDIEATLRALLKPGEKSPDSAAWVYASGPSSLLTNTANVCIDLEGEAKKGQLGMRSLTHCTANWEV